MKQKKSKKKIRKIENFTYKFFISFSVVLVISIVFSQISLSKINLEVEKLKIKVGEQENVNQSLNMKINEMASLENINQLSLEQGLSYNNDKGRTRDYLYIMYKTTHNNFYNFKFFIDNSACI